MSTKAAKYVGKGPSTIKINSKPIMPGTVIREPDKLVEKLLRYPDFYEEGKEPIEDPVEDESKADSKLKRGGRKKHKGMSLMDVAPNEEAKGKLRDMVGEES